jgi:hypothetical protein
MVVSSTFMSPILPCVVFPGVLDAIIFPLIMI